MWKVVYTKVTINDNSDNRMAGDRRKWEKLDKSFTRLCRKSDDDEDKDEDDSNDNVSDGDDNGGGWE